MRKVLKSVGVLVLLAAAAYGYARYVEPKLLVYENVNIASDKIQQDFTMVAFSDVHLTDYFDSGQLERIVEKINSQSPDVVLFLGDLYDNYGKFPDDWNFVATQMGKINAKYKYAVYGNHDYGGSAKKIYKQILEGAGFTIFKNQGVMLEYGVNLVGLDDFIFGIPPENNLYNDAFNLVFAHAPDSTIGMEGYDFYIAGHAHGGQVKVPFVKPFALPAGVKTQWGGLEKNSDGSEKYITRGIGTSVLPFRFGAVPEISICKFSKKTVEK